MILPQGDEACAFAVVWEVEAFGGDLGGDRRPRLDKTQIMFSWRAVKK